MSETKTDALSIGAKYQTSAVGLTAKGKATYGQWEVALSVACGIAKSCPFWIGDLLCIGESTYGEKYSQAINDTGFDPGYLRNLKYVCHQVELSLRSDNLTFSHHALVAPCDPADQKKWLGKAVANHWTVKELREAMHEGEGAGDIDGDAEDLGDVLHAVQEYLDGLADDAERLAALHGIERKLRALEKKYGGTP
jgi:hypothetical protein